VKKVQHKTANKMCIIHNKHKISESSNNRSNLLISCRLYSIVTVWYGIITLRMAYLYIQSTIMNSLGLGCSLC